LRPRYRRLGFGYALERVRPRVKLTKLFPTAGSEALTSPALLMRPIAPGSEEFTVQVCWLHPFAAKYSHWRIRLCLPLTPQCITDTVVLTAALALEACLLYSPATNIPYSQLINLIKLRTNSHHLEIERLRHARPRVPRSRRDPLWQSVSPCRCGAPKVHCMMNCIAQRWSAPIFPTPACSGVRPCLELAKREQTCAPCSPLNRLGCSYGLCSYRLLSY
jgi:hypothetical protein